MATCSCKLFEFWGILCRHILSIFLQKDCHEIPSNYLSSWWRLQTLHKDDDVIEDQIMDCNNEVYSQQIVRCSPISKTKGRSKQRHIKGGKELSHNMNVCGLCKYQCHNVVTSPKRKKEDKQEEKKLCICKFKFNSSFKSLGTHLFLNSLNF